MGQMTQADSKSGLRELAELLKALADETRLTILTMLQDGEMCVCEIMDALPFSQPAVSHHLKILRQAGLITDRRQGKWIYYSLNSVAMKAAGELLQNTIFLPAGNMQTAGEGLSKRHPGCENDEERGER